MVGLRTLQWLKTGLWSELAGWADFGSCGGRSGERGQLGFGRKSERKSECKSECEEGRGFVFGSSFLFVFIVWISGFGFAERWGVGERWQFGECGVFATSRFERWIC
jgi:hypothetical protein